MRGPSITPEQLARERAALDERAARLDTSSQERGAPRDDHRPPQNATRIGDTPDTWVLRSVLDGVDLDAPPPSPELLGVVYSAKLHLISGRPETAKTWLALAAVIEAIRAGGAGLIIDTDGNGQRDIAMRLLGMGLTVDQAQYVGYADDPRELLIGAVGELEKWITAAATAGPVVVVLDSINTTIAALGCTLDEAGMTSFEALAIAPLRRAGAAILMVDHTAIHADADSPYSIGTQRKHAAADVHLRLIALGDALTRGGKPATFLMRGMKDRPGGLERHGRQQHVGRAIFTPNPEGGVAYDVQLGPPSVGEQRATWRPTILMERVSTWAAMQPAPFSKRAADDGVTGKSEAVRQAVDVLYTEGFLAAVDGRYQHVHAYRQRDDPEAENSGDAPPGASRGASPAETGRNSAEGASPRPADNHAVSEGCVPLEGRMRPDSGGGGASPASPSLRGDAGRAPGDAPHEDWRDLLPDNPNGTPRSPSAGLSLVPPSSPSDVGRRLPDDARGVQR